jgi:hypothetical protein
MDVPSAVTPGVILSQLASSKSVSAASANTGGPIEATMSEVDCRKMKEACLICATAWTLRDIAEAGCSTRDTPRVWRVTDL